MGVVHLGIMDSANSLQSSLGVYNSSFLRSKSSILPTKGPNSLKFDARLRPSTKYCASVSYSRSGYWIGAPCRRSHAVRASLSSESSGPASPIAPLKLESPVGQFLSQILVNHPHLLRAAVDQQLEQLQTDRDAEDKQQEPSATGMELVLYRRIAEVKSNEREKALEDILYALVVQRFMDARVSLIPSISPTSSDPSGHIDSWPRQDDELRKLHSPEAYEMIQNHLALILGNRLAESTSIAEISKIRVGQVYAASVMYGYFLKRVDQRFQLEKTMKMKTLPSGSVEDHFNVQKAVVENESVGSVQFDNVVQPARLRLYVMSFDGEMLRKYATIRSRESVSIIEKHTEALFGRPEVVITPEGTVDPSRNEHIKISLGGLKRLVLEAVTFGSFLWDVESYADSRHHFVLN